MKTTPEVQKSDVFSEREDFKINEPIAIVGLSCRFPEANSLDEFWEILKNGVDTIKEIPADRWNTSDYYDPDLSAARKTHQRVASMLEKIHDFDPFFFNISPAEASEMNPSQKIMLELAWEAIENSTIPFTEIRGRKVGVYVGSIWSDYQHLRKHRNASPTSHSSMGQSSDLIANRVSFSFGFTGPSLVVDTGCSSSLVALNFACQSLWDGTNEMAMAGGINIILDPDQYILLSKFGGLSVNGKCSTFDADADGFVRGEGAGILLLKRLSDAERDGDKIYALIRGTAVNNNGFNVNLPATSVDGQRRVLEDAYAHAGVAPHEVHYVEAHGTGTKLGDPTEAKALGTFFKQGRGDGKLLVGSVKTNIGHTEATAGIAGILKVVLAMQRGVLPASLNFRTPNPEIPFEELKIKVNDVQGEWPVKEGETKKAGVNSFGWGGTNAHAVLEEYVKKDKEVSQVNSPARYVLPISARSPQALKDYARAYREKLDSISDEKSLCEFCVAAAVLKPGFEYRTLLSGTDKQELVGNLDEFIQDENEASPSAALTEKDKIVFIFPGQGSQWLGMGRELFEKEEVFRKAIEACDAAFKPYTDWSLKEQLFASQESSRLEEINVIQPSLFALQVALAKYWMSLGINPHTVVGHSMGEVAAAHIAGVLSLDDAAKVICTRSLLMKRVSGQGGAMAVTELTVNEANEIVKRYPRLSVAVSNSPKSTVLAGEKESIDKVLAELESKGLFCKPVKVDVASHSQQMDPLKDDLRAALQTLEPHKAEVPLYSTVKNSVMQGEEMKADYWVNNLRGTVQFSSAIEHLMKSGHVVFIEVSPHPVLTTAVSECAEHFKTKAVTIASLLRNKPEIESFFKNLGDLFSKGYNINWQRFYQAENVPFAQLPSYPFQRERYELEDRSSELDNVLGNASYPMLGSSIELADVFNKHFWESRISIERFSFLRSRKVNDVVVFPEAAYIEMLLEAAAELQEGCLPVIENMVFMKPVLLTDDEPLHIQLKMNKFNSNNAVFQFYRKNDPSSKNSSWSLLAEGDLTFYSKHEPDNSIPYISQPEAKLVGKDYYQSLQALGISCGEYFNSLNELTKAGDTLTFKITPDARFHQWAKKYRLHPAIIDTFFQPVFYRLLDKVADRSARATHVTGIRQIDYFGGTDYKELHGYVTFTSVAQDSSTDVVRLEADLSIFNADTPVMQVKGIKVESARMLVAEDARVQQRTLSFLENYIQLPDMQEKLGALEQLVMQHVSTIIKTSSSKIKNTMTFKGVGIDSLMAIQLRNLLEKDLFLKLSVGMFWAHPSIREYAVYLQDVLAQNVTNDGYSEVSPRHALHELIVKSVNEEKEPVYEEDNRWFVIPKPNSNAKIKLFCFHDAGGSAALFHNWENLLDDNFEVISVELPGRGRRMSEKPYTQVSALIQDLMPQLEMKLDRPYIFLGHSMGGLIAFEAIRELRKRNHAMPLKLFISSTAGLTSYTKADVDYRLSETDLINAYPHLDIGNIGDEELQQLLMKILRADLELIYNYDYTHVQPLDVPIIAIHGNDDTRVRRHQIAQWEKETMANFKLIDRQGGHGYISHDSEFVAKLIMEESEIVKQIILVA